MKLLLLRCPRCAHALAPGQEDRVFQCPNCRGAIAIDESRLSLMAAQYAAPVRIDPQAWLPFWVYRAKVSITLRKTQGGRSAEKEAQAFWDQPRRVYIPAWEYELADARDLCRHLLEQQPFLEGITPPESALFQPAVLTAEDARKLLDLVIVSIEANRKDWMEYLEYDLRLDSEALWLLPAENKGGTWKVLVKNA
jgi:predicted RNA-binding Zn-ribbon protein involved in translation (DUF1610 family)